MASGVFWGSKAFGLSCFRNSRAEAFWVLEFFWFLLGLRPMGFGGFGAAGGIRAPRRQGLAGFRVLGPQTLNRFKGGFLKGPPL